MGKRLGRAEEVQAGLAETAEPGYTSLPERAFRRAAMGGLFRRVVLTSDWTHFRVRGDLLGGGSANLVLAKGDELRRFLNPAAALAMLRRMGVVRVEVEMGEWDVEMATLTMRMRPDVTARRLQMRRNAPKDMLREAAKINPALAAQSPQGAEERGLPSGGLTSRGEERWRLLETKLRGLAEKAQQEEDRARAERTAAEEAERMELRRKGEAYPGVSYAKLDRIHREIQQKAATERREAGMKD